MIHITAMLHASAEIDRATVSIGRLSRVWQFASVIRSSVIGEACSIASGAIVDGARLGDRCIVSHGAFIGPGAEIGSDVFIGPHVSLCNDAWPRTAKDGFDLAPLIDGTFVTIRVLSGASLGVNAVVLPGVTIGAGTLVAAGAVVTRNVPDGYLWKRDGTAVRMDSTLPVSRMRRA